MNKRFSVYLLGIAAVLATAQAFIMSKPTVETQVQISYINNTLVNGPVAATDLSTFDTPPQINDLVSSLAGTHHGVQLKSRNQQFIITASLKDLFDYSNSV